MKNSVFFVTFFLASTITLSNPERSLHSDPELLGKGSSEFEEAKPGLVPIPDQEEGWINHINDTHESIPMAVVAGNADHITEYTDPDQLISEITVDKSARRLTAKNRDGDVLMTARVALGANPKGPKMKEGDEKTPEGTYTLGHWNEDSKFHLSIFIPYPSAADKTRSRENGITSNFGGEIFLHGTGYGPIDGLHHLANWTDGCIGVSDAEIENIYRRINRKVVSPVKIKIVP